ncbi:MAG: FecR domain-containing protein [Bacteroidales bacterium]|nr:FecR domain-containing protein [Bacteroidales bacterium]
MKKKEEHRINDSLLIKFLTKEADENEIIGVNNWLIEDEANKRYLEQVKKIWRHSEALNNFDSIDIDSDFNAVLRTIEKNKKVIKLNNQKLFLRIAASIVILLSVGVLIKNVLFQDNLVSVITQNNEQKEILLSDGSVIQLNSNSKLEYPEKFRRKSREIKFEGEAFLEIQKNPDKPFIISINNSIVEVIGTSFNLNSRSNQVTVDMVTGKTSFYSEENRKEKITLLKGERGVYKENKLSKSTNENANFLAWKTGKLEFRNTKLKEVIPELEKYYGIRFIINDTSINDLVITTTIDNQTFKEVMDEFEIIFDIIYEVSNESVIIKK